MPDYYPRNLHSTLTKELENNKILILTGPRQSGKTTLLKQISEELKEQDKQVYYYNFDRIADLEFFKKQQKIEAFLKIRSLKSRLFVFIDEVQRKKNAGTFFKYFYDAGLNVKFIFSGSSSIELTENFGDALTGRKRIFTLLPLSLKEIARGRMGEEADLIELEEPIAMEKFREIVEECLIWGSYPEVAQRKTEEAKMKALGELYESYVQKDVKDLLRVKNISGFNLLVKVLAHHIGEPVFTEDLVRQTGLHTATVNSYLDILEGTMIIGQTENYNPEFSDKLPKSKRYYFIDNGMRNYALSQLQTGYRADWKKLAINLIYSELRKDSKISKSDIHHYQTYSDNNVDFVTVSKTTGEITPMLVRYPDDKEKLGKKVHEYLNSHSPQKLTIVTKDLEAEELVKECKVEFVRLENWLS